MRWGVDGWIDQLEQYWIHRSSSLTVANDLYPYHLRVESYLSFTSIVNYHR